MSPTLYSVDTSALFDGLERYYPESMFPGLWERIDGLIGAGRFFISEEVWAEARVHDAVTKSWCDDRGKNNLAVPTDAVVTREVTGILTQFPKLVANIRPQPSRRIRDCRRPATKGDCRDRRGIRWY